MIINSVIAGSGGGSLDLNVVAYSSAFPSSAPENTIGILTDTPITKYVFSAVQPEDPAEGMVWIKTGLESTTPIPVSAKNSAFLFPIGASRYQNGAWTKIASENVRCYQSGWKMWRKYIYENGNNYGHTYSRDGTGSWTYLTGDYINSLPNNRAVCNEAVDITGYTKLIVEYEVYVALSSTGSYRMFGFHNTRNTGNGIDHYTYFEYPKASGYKSQLDLTGITDGSYYFKAQHHSLGELHIYKIYLEG